MSTTTTTIAASLPPRRMPAWPLAGAVLAGVLTAMSPHPAAVVAFAALTILSLVFLVQVPERDRQHLIAAFLLGLALRGLMVVVLTWIYSSPENPGGLMYRDAVGYHRVGSNIAEMERQDLQFRVEYHTTGTAVHFHRFVGHVYALLGTSTWNMKFLNAFLGAISVLLTYAFAHPIAGRRAAVGTAWMYALWPTAIFWSAQVLKDMPVGFLVILVSALWVRFVTSRNYGWILLALAATCPLYFLRIYIFGFLLLGIYVGVLVDLLQRRRVLLGAAMIALPLFGWTIPFRLGLIDDPAVMLFKLAFAETPLVHGSLITRLAGTGFGYGFIVPLSMVKFLISPLPWKTAGFDNFTVPGIILQYAILPFAVRGGFMLLRQRTLYVLPFVLTTVLTDLLYAVVFLGAIPRHMQMFYPYMFICAVVGMQGWRHWALPWSAIFILGIVAAGILKLAGVL